ncbi:putative ATPase [Paraburkholderia unamae]|uniref:ATP-binding protein n=1 Tax=Paraburkholderia unamae TaxID=219649 RepID=UPI000DC482AD|nr:winged helix-turn-helix domain-containing protein [Paraburkholderia unamae]RAR67909.1 putative ATPase [Paraburkholderia unamae]
MVTHANNHFEFGRTVVSGHRREIMHGGKRVEIGNRAFDLLLLLLEERGTAVSKNRIMEMVWRGRIVGENALEAQVSALRRALSEDRKSILTVAGRGYQFVGRLRTQSEPTRPLHFADTKSYRDSRKPQIPGYASRSFGREADSQEVERRLETARVVTLVGAGGVGKTRLAVETAHRIAHRFPDGVCIVQAGSIRARDELPSLIASALVPFLPDGPAHLLFERIEGKRILVLLDNCEHLLDAISGICETLLEATSSVRLLATSREALRIRDESVFHVSPLDVPPDSEGDDIDRYPSVALLLDRVGKPFDPSDRQAMRAAAEICKGVDGVPLAIELSAECIPALGFDGAAEQLQRRFELLTRGFRTAPARHKTLRASIDWSYEPLSQASKAVLNGLSAFDGPFTLNAAHRKVGSHHLSEIKVTSTIIELVEKSLVTRLPQSNPVMYKLSNTMRAYASEKLQESGAGQ